jgi:tRNA (guanine37-N1)-methyltransferase
MHCGIVSIFPEMFGALTDFGVTGRAIQQKKLKLSFFNPRDFSENAHRTVDDRPYGGGPGMVMMAEPLKQAVAAAKQVLTQEGIRQKTRVIAMSPQGRKIDQASICTLINADYAPIFVAGRYEGIDQRFTDAVIDEEWSLGDYVISGGELAIMVVLDALARWVPGVLGHPGSALADSFVDGLLDCPQYTRPAVWQDVPVPPVLLGGNHRAIADWRRKAQMARTIERRPDLLESRCENEELNQKSV